MRYRVDVEVWVTALTPQDAVILVEDVLAADVEGLPGVNDWKIGEVAETLTLPATVQTHPTTKQGEQQ